jgi:ATP-dependent helicase/nuclease subunit A
VLRQYADCTEEPGGVLATDPVEWAVKIYSRQELGQLEEPVRSDTPLLEQIRNLRPVKAGEGTDWVEAKLGWRYAHSLAIGKPTKLSVTEIKRRFEMLAETDGHRPFEQPPIITRPRFIQASGKLSAAELGILMHTVMQQADFTGDVSESGMVSQVQTMTAKELLLPEQAAAVDTGAAAAFFATDIGQRMIRSPQVRRELPFSLMLPAERFYADLAGSKEAVFVQGVIDVLFDEPDGLVLLDYKTDRVANSAELAERYATQLTIYAEAVETIFKKPVKEKYLYIFSTREAIRI